MVIGEPEVALIVLFASIALALDLILYKGQVSLTALRELREWLRR